MTRPDDEYPPLDVTSTLNLGALEDMLESGDSEVVPARVAGSLPPGTALLLVRRGPNAGARFLLDKEVTTSGRHPESDIFLDDVTVSRRHAEFHRDGGVFTVRDVGSLNGTYVNRERVETATLSNGDEVQIGKFRLVLIAGPKADDAEGDFISGRVRGLVGAGGRPVAGVHEHR
jgi:pSer/pThr/pTyr-binding forkhead associated (FHA) protein